MIEADKHLKYCETLFQRKRLKTIEVEVGNVKIGGENPIRLQSMTTTDTMDTEGSIEQSIRMINAGCELVRITAPSKNEAENLRNIKEGLRIRGYLTPLVADIHFTPNAAEIAAGIVEKVRVNPGNYADKKKFQEIDYTDKSYLAELKRIEDKFTPLVLLCKKNKTAMRIGTNHGSLSDRIMSRYGDTPEGMVESALEFIRICEKHDYFDLVVSMKASNTLVMVQAYRLLVAKMLERGKCYPLHLGVTEAGEGEDGRIKSAVGIGTLLEDGIGDTIRVSLTEAPEEEIPVARKLVEKFKKTENILEIPENNGEIPYSPFHYTRRNSSSIHNIGFGHVPVVFADLSQKKDIKPSNFFSLGYNYSIQLDKWNIQEQAADYVYLGSNEIDFELPGTLGALIDFHLWNKKFKNKDGYYPLCSVNEARLIDTNKHRFVILNIDESIDYKAIQDLQGIVLVLQSKHTNYTHLFRNIYFNFAKYGINHPVILKINSIETEAESFQLNVSSEAGSALIDGFGDGLWIESNQSLSLINTTSFGILQATRTRISKTEYISCPSCGRTLFDLQETTAKIRKETSHLKGLKIGIMGCIVNGPGEMADADYGYVGTGPGTINLYKEKTVVKKNVPEEEAVKELISLIKDNGDWIEPKI